MNLSGIGGIDLMGVRMIASNCAPCKAGMFALRCRIGKSSTMKAYQAIPKLGINLVFPLSLSSILVSGQNAVLYYLSYGVLGFPHPSFLYPLSSKKVASSANNPFWPIRHRE